MKKSSKEFYKKEKVLNYATQTYQLSRPNKVGRVMELIRECHPKSLEEWEKFYFANAFTSEKDPVKINRDVLEELGERLFVKITSIVIPEWITAFNELTLQDCVDYIYNLTINRTFDGYVREISVVEGTLSKIFPDVIFEESSPELDHAGDIDYIGKVNEKCFGIQIKPVTAKANFGNYSVSERMKSSFEKFQSEFGGKVFIVFSVDGKIQNMEVIDQIREEISRLRNIDSI